MSQPNRRALLLISCGNVTRARLLRADADLREMELAKERGLMVALPDIEHMLTDLVLTTKARIMAIPQRLAPELVGETSRVMIQAKLEKSCKEALAYLARTENHKRVGPTELPRRDGSPRPLSP